MKQILLLDTKVSQNKSISLGLSFVYGIGKPTSIVITKKLGISLSLTLNLLTKKQIKQIELLVNKLQLKININLKRYKNKFKKLTLKF